MHPDSYLGPIVGHDDVAQPLIDMESQILKVFPWAQFEYRQYYSWVQDMYIKDSKDNVFCVLSWADRAYMGYAGTDSDPSYHVRKPDRSDPSVFSIRAQARVLELVQQRILLSSI